MNPRRNRTIWSQGGGNTQGPGSRKMSGDNRQQALSKNKCKELIQDMLISSGQRELLKRLVQSRLAQSGWTYSMRTKYIEYIKQKGVENVNVSHMIADVVPKGVETFPETVKKEIGDILWDFASEYITVDDSVQPPSEIDNSYAHTDFLGFQYQSKDCKPDPGLGINVAMPELNLSRTPSPVTIPRPLTPQPPIPILRPETIETEIKEEPIIQEDNGCLSSEEENDDDEEEEEEEDVDDEGDDEISMNHNEESEEELMDV